MRLLRPQSLHTRYVRFRELAMTAQGTLLPILD